MHLSILEGMVVSGRLHSDSFYLFLEGGKNDFTFWRKSLDEFAGSTDKPLLSGAES